MASYLLNDAQIDHYQRTGYVIPDFRLSEDNLMQIKATHARLVEQYPQFTDYCGSLLAFDPWFLGVARTPEILDMVEQLIGPDFALWNSSLFAKPARHGTRTPWHQDGEYWPIRPLATCSAWIALDDTTTENGCLRFLPGSHQRRELAEHHHNPADSLSLPLELDTSAYDEREAVDLVLEAGQMSLHDIFLMHGSEPNTSEHPRRGMTLRYMPLTSVYRRDLARPVGDNRMSMSNRTLYLMRGNDQTGENDFRIRY